MRVSLPSLAAPGTAVAVAVTAGHFINDAYAVKNLRVPIFEPGQQFKHLVLTGRNGSGKTTVLKAVMEVLQHDSKKPNNASKMFFSYN